MARIALLCAVLLALCGCEDRAQSLVGKGNAFAAKGKLDDAAKAYDEAARLVPTDSRPLELLGNVKLEQQDLTAARAAFEQALKLNPTSVEALVGLGRIEGESGRLDPALDYLSRAVDKSQDGSYAMLWQSVYLLRRGTAVDLEVALERADHALTAKASDPSWIYVRGNALVARKDFANAKAAFDELLRIAPQSPLADYGLARLAAAHGDRLGALAQLRQAREKSKADGRSLPPEQVRKDPAFRFLENDPDFSQLVPR
jgi:tetratricopeptide (TPR) repeat protein